MEKKNRTKFNVSKNPADRTYDGVVYDSRAEMMFYRDIVLPGLENGEVVGSFCITGSVPPGR